MLRKNSRSIKRFVALILTLTFSFTGFLEEISGIDWNKAFAYSVPAGFSQMAGAIGNIEDSKGPIQSFHTDLFTGRATASVPITVPPGRLGLSPSLALSYSSSGGNSWIGTGWNLDTGFIQRSVKRGVPAYNDSQDTFEFLINGVHSELVKVSTSYEYHAKDEGGDFLKFMYVSGYWTMQDKSGTTYTFGQNPQAQTTNIRGIYSWCLEKIEDVNGNTIHFTYTKDQGQTYLSRIDYNGNELQGFPDTHSVEFTLENRPDATFSYITGAKVTGAMRLKKVTAKVQGQIAREYTLTYEQSPYVNKSRLISVRECGKDQSTCLPPQTFTYYNVTPAFQNPVTWQQFDDGSGATNAISDGIDQETLTTADMDGDGLPDRLRKLPNTNEWRFYPNTGSSHNGWIPWNAIQGAPNNNTSVFGDPNAAWNSLRADSNGTGSYVNLVDLDGDGRLDRVVSGNSNNAGGSNNWMVQYNLGYSFANQTSYGPASQNQNLRSGQWVPGDPGNPADQLATTWDLVDMNGDGYLDRVQYYNVTWQSQSSWHVYLGSANGFSTSYTDWGPLIADSCPQPLFFGIRGIDYDYRGSPKATNDLIDMNGDGLPDRVLPGSCMGSTGFMVQFNNGKGFEPPVSFPLPTSSYGDNIRILDNTTFDLIDMNGDGLPDRVEKVSDSQWQVFFNTGSGFLTTPVIWSNIQGYSSSDRYIHKAEGSKVTVDTFDINGDGLVDRIVTNNTPNWLVQFSTGPTPDLLKTINNGTGGTTTISYKPSTKYYNGGSDGIPKLPFPVMTVSSITQTDGMGNVYTTNYTYWNGLYDKTSREFRGFGQARVIDSQGNYSDTWFKQDNVFKGRPYLNEFRDAQGKLYRQSFTVYDFVGPYVDVNYSFLKSVTNWIYDGNSSYKVTETDYLYDQYGNVRETIEWGDVDTNHWATNSGDEKRVQTQYTYNPDLWIMNKPRHTAVYDSNWNRMQESWFYYDGNTDWLGIPTKGLLTKQEDLIQLYGQTVNVQMTYDPYGNLLTVKNARGYTTTNQYETNLHLYLTKVTNALNQTKELIYDPLIAQITQTKDENAQTTQTVYDALGRVTAVIEPLDSISSPTKAIYYDTTSFPNRIIMHIKTDSNAPALNIDDGTHTGYLTIYSFRDGLGREIQKRSPSNTSSNQIVSGVITFDTRGQMKEQYAPYFSSVQKFYMPDYLGVPKATFTYDAPGRRVRTDFPNGTFSTIQYDDFVKTVTDTNGHQKRYTQDAYGNLAKVEEFNQGQIYTTTYTYDAMNRLVQSIDQKGKSIQTSYDMLGRKTDMIDQDMGHWYYTYDPNGNLLTQKDAKNQTITFTYDPLNRLTKKTYPDTSHIDYTYDSCDPMTCGGLLGTNYPIGKLLKIIDKSGVQTFRYDQKGRMTQDKKSLDDGHDYTFTKAYDPMGRVMGMQYPDNETMGIIYNAMGEAESIYSADIHGNTQLIISSVDYNASGQITKLVYGNGTVTDYTYNPQTLRLEHLVTKDSASALIQDFGYQFDNAGNVKAITDSINTNTQSFLYDDLDRLTQATGTYGLQVHTYDAVGNMLQKGPATLTYGASSHPHAVTHFQTYNQSIDYQYDANGNMTGRTFSASSYDALNYDYDNRLTNIIHHEIQDNGGCHGSTDHQTQTAAFTYDAGGARVKKVSAGGGSTPGGATTYYLGKDYEIEYKSSGSLTRKAFFLGQTRIAEKEISSSGIPHFRWFHGDHLGSTNVVTNEQGVKTLLMEYTPYGEVKIRAGSDVVKNTFTGQKEDIESGLMYYNARYYDPKIGRFITADPTIQHPNDPQDFNRYAYCRNNPIRFVDPTGLSIWSWIKKIFSAVVGVIVGTLVAAATGGNLALGIMAGVATYRGMEAALNGANFRQTVTAMVNGAGEGLGLFRNPTSITSLLTQGPTTDHVTSEGIEAIKFTFMTFGMDSISSDIISRQIGIALTPGHANFEAIVSQTIDGVMLNYGSAPRFSENFSKSFKNDRLPGAKYFSLFDYLSDIPYGALSGLALDKGSDLILDKVEAFAVNKAVGKFESYGRGNFVWMRGLDMRYFKVATVARTTGKALEGATVFYTSADVGTAVESAYHAYKGDS